MKLIPCGDHVLIERDVVRDMFGAVRSDEKAQTGAVRAIGPGKYQPEVYAAALANPPGEGLTWARPGDTSTPWYSPAPCAVGDRVVFARFAGNPEVVDGVEYLLVQFADIIAVIDEGPAGIAPNEVPQTSEPD